MCGRGSSEWQRVSVPDVIARWLAHSASKASAAGNRGMRSRPDPAAESTVAARLRGARSISLTARCSAALSEGGDRAFERQAEAFLAIARVAEIRDAAGAQGLLKASR
jgi:hypothetical protein